ncbi:MAG: hypothetical protein J0H68_01945 [Sphingobacteriia bacterium]|nr:hypothetical protein [Sphingobacteriia bacterium]
MSLINLKELSILGFFTGILSSKTYFSDIIKVPKFKEEDWKKQKIAEAGRIGIFSLTSASIFAISGFLINRSIELLFSSLKISVMPLLSAYLLNEYGKLIKDTENKDISLLNTINENAGGSYINKYTIIGVILGLGADIAFRNNINFSGSKLSK